jgi:Fe2+ or Zn2+ uptake regulation protein
MNLQDSSESIYDLFVKALQKAGLRQTQERFAILRAIIEIKVPFQIVFLQKQLLSTKYYVSRGTLYNTLKLMEQIGILEKNFQNGKNFYVLNNQLKNSYVIVNQKEIKEIQLEEEVEQLLISHIENKYNMIIKRMKITFFQD